MPFNHIQGLVPTKQKVVSPHVLIIKVSGNITQKEVEDKLVAFTRYIGARYLDRKGRMCFNVRVRNAEAQQSLLPKTLMDALPDSGIRVTAARYVL